MSRLSKYREFSSGDVFKGFEIKEILGASKDGHYQAEFICTCGDTFIRNFSYMERKYNHGCLACSIEYTADTKRKFKVKHRRLYSTWKSMNYRCKNEKAPYFKDYGGRGIKVCSRWCDSDLEGFENFYDDMGTPDTGLSLDRIDVNGNYEPSNCRWATLTEQANNTRTNHVVVYEGVSYTVTQLARKFNIKPNTLEYRLLRGWSIEDAVSGSRDTPWVRPYSEKLTDLEFNRLLIQRFQEQESLTKLSTLYGISTGNLSRMFRKQKVLDYYNDLLRIEVSV